MTEAKCFLCGAAKKEITPTEANGILPYFKGAGGFGRIINDVLDPLYVRVIAFSDGGKPVLFVSFDIMSYDGDMFVPGLAEHLGIAQEAIFTFETTTHSTMALSKRLDPQSEASIKQEKWLSIIRAQLQAAADEAIVSLRPAKAAISRTNSYINVNRDRPHHARLENGTFDFTSLGYNGAGDSDKTLTVIRFDDENGYPIAVISNYGCFNVILHTNQCGKDGGMAISADLAGFVTTHLEAEYPGAIAVWCNAAGCNQNPIVMTQMYYPDPVTGEPHAESCSPEASKMMLKYLGSIHYADILRGVQSAVPVEGDTGVKYIYGASSVPGRSVERKVQYVGSNGREHYCYEYGKAEDYPIHLGILLAGGVTFVCHSGGIYSSVGRYLKQQSLAAETVIVTGYRTGDGIFDGAICDDEGLANGGHDPSGRKYRPGFIQNETAKLMNRLIEEVSE